jgi:hypothetical protein
MDSGLTFTISIIVIVLVFVLIQLGLFQNRKKQELEYPQLWEKFESCKKLNAYTDLIAVGNKLMYNKYLSQEHLTIIHETAIELQKRFPEFEALRLNAYNKQLDYNRTMPSAWSSGGIKQTWSNKE